MKNQPVCFDTWSRLLSIRYISVYSVWNVPLHVKTIIKVSSVDVCQCNPSDWRMCSLRMMNWTHRGCNIHWKHPVGRSKQINWWPPVFGAKRCIIIYYCHMGWGQTLLLHHEQFSHIFQLIWKSLRKDARKLLFWTNVAACLEQTIHFWSLLSNHQKSEARWCWSPWTHGAVRWWEEFHPTSWIMLWSAAGGFFF